MEKVPQAKFAFERYFIRESKISRSVSDISDKSANTKLGKFGLDVSAFGIISESQRKFQLDLNVIIKENKNRFVAEVKARGLYKFDENQTKDTLRNYFYINAPAILFPYLRAYIATLTSLSGMEPIHIPTLNLTSLGEELKKNTKTIE